MTAARPGRERRSWIVLGSANGSTNVGDQCMWEATVDVLRREFGPVPVVTDGPAEWSPTRPDVVVLPYLHTTLRRGRWVSHRLRDRTTLGIVERAISRPRRNQVAHLLAARALRAPRGALQQAWAEAVSRAEGLVISGAGAINDDFAPHGIAAWDVMVQWTKAAGKPVVLLGQGVGPVTEPQNVVTAARMLAAADVLTVREQQSREQVRELGVDRADVHVTPDWALLSATTAADRLMAERVRQDLTRAPFLALSVHRRHTTTARDLDRLAVVVERVALTARRRGAACLVIPAMTAGGYSDDRKTARLVSSRLSSPARSALAPVDARLSAGVTRALVGMAQGLVSTRYHPMVFALSAGVPACGLSYDDYYDQKLSGLSMLFGVRDNVTRLPEASRDPDGVLDGLDGQAVMPLAPTELDAVAEPFVDFARRRRDHVPSADTTVGTGSRSEPPTC